jgi:hypothetical protein
VHHGLDRTLCLSTPRRRPLRGHLPRLRNVQVLGAGGRRAGLACRCADGAAVGEGADRAR